MDAQMFRQSVLIPSRVRSAKEYRICSIALQDQILEVLHRVDRPGVTALGHCRDGECYILVECDSPIDLVHTQRVIKAMGVVFSEVFDHLRVDAS